TIPFPGKGWLRVPSRRRSGALPDVGEPAAQCIADPAKISSRVRSAFFPAHLRNQAGRIGRGRIYDYEADGAFERDGFPEVRASVSRGHGEGRRAASDHEPGEGKAGATEGRRVPAKVPTSR